MSLVMYYNEEKKTNNFPLLFQNVGCLTKNQYFSTSLTILYYKFILCNNVILLHKQHMVIIN